MPHSKLSRPYKKSVTFDSLTRLHRSLSNRVRRTRSSGGPADLSVKAADEGQSGSVVKKSTGDVNESHESSLSTDASSYSSLDADAALLSSTLVKVHQNTDGWQTGNWDQDDVSVDVTLLAKRTVMPDRIRATTRLSLCGITCCGKIDQALSFDEDRFLPYNISRRRSTIRPRMEIECVFRGQDDASHKNLFANEDHVQHGQSTIPKQIVSTDDNCVTNSDIINNNVFPLPAEWIHSPLLLTATPGSGTVIRRIRRVSDAGYFPHPATMPTQTDSKDNIMGPNAQLPINNGKEIHTLVIDFETPSFEGTALFRIRGSNSDLRNPLSLSTPKIRNGAKTMTKTSAEQQQVDYFASYNRKFQMVIRGKFRRPDVAMADCMSGMVLDHPLRTTGSSVIDDPLMACSEIQHNIQSSNGAINKKTRRKKIRGSGNSHENLPPKWVLRASVKIAGLFSPRIDADLECSHPRILGPLCSMAQSLHVARGKESPMMDMPHVEPHFQSKESLVYDLRHDPSCVGVASGGGSNASVQIRKKAFDAVYDARIATSSSSQSSSPCFDPNAVYTFEFLQHLIDYNDFSLDFGSIVGKMKLGGALKGQPCRFVAGVVPREAGGVGERNLTLRDLDCLWSFDLWHESLYLGKRDVDL
ncbi:hypothetical protein ACHAW6_012433 [Cyclotella cf. meneghiniana]